MKVNAYSFVLGAAIAVFAVPLCQKIYMMKKGYEQ